MTPTVEPVVTPVAGEEADGVRKRATVTGRADGETSKRGRVSTAFKGEGVAREASDPMDIGTVSDNTGEVLDNGKDAHRGQTRLSSTAVATILTTPWDEASTGYIEDNRRKSDEKLEKRAGTAPCASSNPGGIGSVPLICQTTWVGCV